MSSSDPLRLLHLADLHLGASCAFLKEKAGERMKDFERAFERAMAFAREKKNGIDLVVIAGDLFDSHSPEQQLVDVVRAEFAELKAAGIQVVVLPGTHDTVSYANCVYRTKDFGGVHLLTDNSTCPLSIDVSGHTVYIYGIVRSPDCREVPLDKLSRVSGEGIHIGVLHAAVRPTSDVHFSDDEFNVTVAELAKTRLDYVALGHYHTFNQYDCDGVVAVYPGTLEGRSFRETGQRYLVTATLTGERLIVDKTPFSARAVLEKTFDLNSTPCADWTELCGKLAGLADKDAIIRLTITGDAEFGFDVERIQKILSDRFFYIEVMDETRMYSARWVEQFKREPTVRGIFVRKMAEKLEKAGTDEEKRLLDMALKFGLMELAGDDAD